MKIVLIGAGSAQFGCGTMGDIFQSDVLKGSEICLMDINQSALDKVFKVGNDFIKNKNLDFKLTTTTDRESAIKKADFVIISIEVGDRFELWDQDWKTPLQYGVRQIYGENGGPGGLFHALRIVPPILEICSDIVKFCPEAFVFCYSNPMTAITTTVLRKYPELKFIGMCHEIASLERYLPTILDTPFENLDIQAAGLNHFSVLLNAKYKDSGKDAYDDIMKKAPSFFENEPGYSDIWEYTQITGKIPETEGAIHRHKIGKETSSRSWSDRTLFHEIMKNFKLFPITVDSHLGEYLPWAQDAADHRGILDFYAFYRFALSQDERLEIDDSEMHERVVPILEGILTDSGYTESAVNIMNKGLIKELPDNVAVEVPGRISARGIEGIKIEKYPIGFAALLRNYCGVYDVTADAILQGSRDLVIQAVLVNPGMPIIKNVDEMVDLMLSQQRKWLSYIK
ncbi:MAG: alpha-glucosidase [Spirochaetaceae bacterium]|nr:alpha-glucosidase [Spirochaetaceae bacterium]